MTISKEQADELTLKFYKEQIENANDEYQLSESAGDPEIYYERIDAQDSKCERLIDDYKQHMANKDTLSELDLLLDKNNTDISKSSKEYKLLYRKFLEINIDVCRKKVQMFKTGGYTSNEYDVKQPEQLQKNEKEILAIKPINKGREERASTHNKRVIINNIAQEMRKKSPTVSKQIIAEDVAEVYKEKTGEKISPGTILKDYSDEL